MKLIDYLLKKHNEKCKKYIFIFIRFADQNSIDYNGLISYPNSITAPGKTATQWLDYFDHVINILPEMESEIEEEETKLFNIVII